MIERFVDVHTGDGEMNTFIVHPEQHGPHPLVLFLMDAPGMREEIRDMSRRLATAGYYVMAPHLYYRDVTGYNLFETGDRERMGELMSSLSNAKIVGDAQALISLADHDEAADAAKVGVVGYCMSGPFAIYLAGQIPDRIRAAASFHGVSLVTDADDSPHLQLADAQAEVYVGAAETDSYAPPEMVDAFEAALTASGRPGRVEWYPGTEHGFTFRERGALYDKAASERHWERMHDLFSRNLKP
ncbi:MAG TPA: dienelactone hydrolase family protein [Ilumatobacter sp.]|nr:dienelactone hydrolase family protein [Ilumatobacter sp.]